jgi:hypothetical protein
MPTTSPPRTATDSRLTAGRPRSSSTSSITASSSGTSARVAARACSDAIGRPTISSASRATVKPVDSPPPHHPSVPQHRHVIGERHHLAELVGDEHDRHALRLERAQRGEQLVDLLRA